MALYVAAGLTVLLGIAHSVLGERYILMRLFRRGEAPALFGGPLFTLRTMRFAWHITSIAWWGFAAMLVVMALSGESPGMFGTVIAVTMLLTGVTILVGSRGRHLAWPVFIAIAALVLSGCSSLSPYSERPEVQVTSFEMSPQSVGMAPTFVVGIRVVNPNSTRLPLVGMSYSVDIEGNRILSGAAADLPVVPAYGTAEFTIEAGTDLIGGARLIADLLSRDRDSLNFLFRARMDVGRWLPDIRIEERGAVPLR